MKELKRKMQDAFFEENLRVCLQKPRMYDERGNKCSTPGNPSAKRYVPPIEMNEAFSRDVVKEMVGDDTRRFMSATKNCGVTCVTWKVLVYANLV